ncbi:hypothetical protein evm_009526 [Chilo suppressalis]|nr:hypothetical protein evm_009526 [Chilo suppressalis]
MCRGRFFTILLSLSMVVTAIDVKKTCEVRVELKDRMINVINKDELCSCLMYEKSASITHKTSEPCELKIDNSGEKLAISADNICECAGYRMSDKGKENTTTSETHLNATTAFAVADFESTKHKIATTTDIPIVKLKETDVTHLAESTVSKSEITETKSSDASTVIIVKSTVTSTDGGTRKISTISSGLGTTEKIEVFETTNTPKDLDLIKIDKLKRHITETSMIVTPSATKNLDELNTTFRTITDIIPLFVESKSSTILTDSTKSIDKTTTAETVVTNMTDITNSTIIKSRPTRTTTIFFPKEAITNLKVSRKTNTVEFSTTTSTSDSVRTKHSYDFSNKTSTAKLDGKESTSATNVDYTSKLPIPKTTSIYFFTTELEIKNITDRNFSLSDDYKTRKEHKEDYPTKKDSSHTRSTVDITTSVVNTTQTFIINSNDAERIKEDHSIINIVLIVVILCLFVVLLLVCLKVFFKYFRSGSYVLPRSADRNIEMERKG